MRQFLIRTFSGPSGIVNPTSDCVLDLSQDWKLDPDPVTITYYKKTGEGIYSTGIQVTFCSRTAITKEDGILNPALLEADSTVFHMWRAKMGSLEPKIADKIVGPTLANSGSTPTSWYVERVQKLDHDCKGPQRYRLTCTSKF